MVSWFPIQCEVRRLYRFISILGTLIWEDDIIIFRWVFFSVLYTCKRANSRLLCPERMHFDQAIEKSSLFKRLSVSDHDRTSILNLVCLHYIDDITFFKGDMSIVDVFNLLWPSDVLLDTATESVITASCRMSSVYFLLRKQSKSLLKHG